MSNCDRELIYDVEVIECKLDSVNYPVLINDLDWNMDLSQLPGVNQ